MLPIEPRCGDERNPARQRNKPCCIRMLDEGRRGGARAVWSEPRRPCPESEFHQTASMRTWNVKRGPTMPVRHAGTRFAPSSFQLVPLQTARGEPTEGPSAPLLNARWNSVFDPYGDIWLRCGSAARRLRLWAVRAGERQRGQSVRPSQFIAGRPCHTSEPGAQSIGASSHSRSRTGPRKSRPFPRS